MKLDAVELRRIELPLVEPFRTSFGVEVVRDVLLVRVIAGDHDGWGECVASSAPLYSSEYVDAAQDVIRRFLSPAVFAAGDLTAATVAPILSGFAGHRMSKAALELAVLDCELRAQEIPLSAHLGGAREAVECGVSVGIYEDPDELVDRVAAYVDEGYVRIKLKIEPGNDVAQVRAVREHFGESLALQVDANTAYSPDDMADLQRLDEFGLLLIEQPFPEERLLAHATLARAIRTPVCLDESITSAAVAVEAIELQACSIVNIKAGRVGGYLEAKRVHDECARRGVPVWCGGMLESGIGRAANVALASLPNFLLPGDTSASGRYFERDVTEPFVLQDGTLSVPSGPGIGVTPLPEVLEVVTKSVETVYP